jgi:hypothetical protein
MDIACMLQPLAFYPGCVNMHGVIVPAADQWKDLQEPVLDVSFVTEVAHITFAENETKRHNPSK